MTNYLIGNWKMNLLPDEAVELAESTQEKINAAKKTISGFSATNLCIPALLNYSTDKFLVGAQNAYYEDSGAYTGEVSALMHKNIGTDYIIIGHSERRSVFNESQTEITKRAESVLKSDLKLVYCIGETEEENAAGRTYDVLAEQLLPVLELDQSNLTANTLIAYEPVWAIGTGKVATPEIVNEVTSHLAGLIQEKLSISLPILYGGSVKPDNYAELINLPAVDGALVGGASLKAESFLGLLEISEKA